jgi:hypothetical protein
MFILLIKQYTIVNLCMHECVHKLCSCYTLNHILLYSYMCMNARIDYANITPQAMHY